MELVNSAMLVVLLILTFGNFVLYLFFLRQQKKSKQFLQENVASLQKVTEGFGEFLLKMANEHQDFRKYLSEELGTLDENFQVNMESLVNKVNINTENVDQVKRVMRNYLS